LCFSQSQFKFALDRMEGVGGYNVLHILYTDSNIIVHDICFVLGIQKGTHAVHASPPAECDGMIAHKAWSFSFRVIFRDCIQCVAECHTPS
jgi:hypothetical protein